MAKIYIVEDDEKIRVELAILLERYDYECVYTNQFKDIINSILQEKPDLVLLDINLPYFDGFHVCKELRKKTSIPIIVVTSRDTDLDELMSINLGADDFITKPYNSQILLARIKSILNRSQNEIFIEKLEYNDVILDIPKNTVLYKSQEIELTKNEFRILNLLVKSHGKIISRNEIMNELWQSDQFIDDNTLTVNISRLRDKLEDLGLRDYIITKRSKGYIVL